MNAKTDLKEIINKLLKSQKLAVLATKGKVYPYNTLVGYAFTDDLKLILFATMMHTRKYENIKNNPYVSFLIDSRKNYTSDFKNAVALTITGKAVTIKKVLKKKYKKLYLKRFPHLGDFISDPDTSIVAIKVDRYIFVQNFREVLELKMK